MLTSDACLKRRWLGALIREAKLKVKGNTDVSFSALALQTRVVMLT